jgi:hypothetical protein
MVQPKYSPEEALQRIKLMMEYKTSKTLDENIQMISEQPSPGEVAATTAGAGIGAATVGGAGAAYTAASTGAGLAGVGSGLAGLATVSVLGPAAVGAVAAYGLYKLVKWYANKDLGKSGFAQVMSVCTAPGMSKMVPKMSKGEIRNLAYSIEDAKGDWNDDEDAIVSVFQKVETIADLCALDKKVTGGLVEFLDNLTDSPDEWKMFTRPLAGMIEDTEIVLTPEEQKKSKGIPGDAGPARKKTGGYKSCSGTYSYGCKSNAIAEVQGCLGLTTDGKFGPKTKAALSGKGFTTFTDKDVTKICSKTTTIEKPKDEFTTQVDADNVDDILNM